MTTRLSVLIPSGGFSDPVDLGGKQLVGALVSTSAWDGASSNLDLIVQAPVEDSAPYATWRDLNGAYLALLGSGNAVTQHYYYAPIPAPYNDLPPTVRFGWLGTAGGDITVVLILKSGCTVSVSC